MTLKHYFLGTLWSVIFLFTSHQSWAQEPPTTIYLIRHAEKDRSQPSDKDPHLNSLGIQRANRWRDFFKNIPLDAVFSTDYHRTKQTASPTALDHQLEVQIYPPIEVNLDSILEVYKGGNMLIVGHSNTTPLLTNKIIGVTKYSDLEDRDNSSLFIVQLEKSTFQSVKIKIENPPKQ